jgi:F-type H+-transporting ATPase subunit delta
VIVDAVTTRYAGALYGLAARRQALAEVARDVAALERELANPATRAIVFHPRIEGSKKRAQLAPVIATMHPLTRNFVELVLSRGRAEVLRGVAEAFRRRELEERGVVEGVVESARPLGAPELARIATAVGARLGKEVQLESRIVPELLGGVRVIAANRMIDSSVQGRLESLRRRMMDVRLPSAPRA